MPTLPRDRRLSAAVSARGASSERPRRLVRPVYLLLAGLIVGILLANVAPLPPILLFLAGAALLAAASLFPRSEHQTATSVAVLIAPFVVIGAGLARQASLPAANDLSLLAANGPSLWVEGTVASDPEIHPSGALSFTLAARAINDFRALRRASGRVQVVIAHPEPDAPTPLPGDALWLRGRVEEPEGITNPNGFDERAFLARRGIHSTMVVRRASDIRVEPASSEKSPFSRLAMAVRNRVLRVIDSNLDPDDAAVLDSILLSEHSRLTADTKNAYERTGALHILSVSGPHLAALAGALSWVFGLIGGVHRRIANPIIIGVLWTLALASGGGVASLRSAVVFTIVLMAPVLRRAVADPVHSLAVAAFVLLVANPLSLYDPGFQLSFATIAVLLVWLPMLESIWLPWEPGESVRSNAARRVLVVLLAGVIAQISSWPLVAYYYNIYSIVSPIVSLLVAPLAVLLLLGGLGTIALSMLLPRPILVPLWGIMHFLLHLLHFVTFSFANISFGAFSIVSFPAFSIVMYYALLGGGAALVRKRISQSKNSRPRGGSDAASAHVRGGAASTS